MKEHVLHSFQEAKTALENLLANENTVEGIVKAGDTLTEVFRKGGRVFSCGNGGSMCDAMHFAEELSGRYRLDRRGLPAAAINDPGHISCVSNDYGYDNIFSRYLESHAKRGDCLVGLSTSGRSKNVIKAARMERERGMAVVALTGRLGRAARRAWCR